MSRTVVLTGATSGIGRVASIALAREGARMVLVARDRERGERALIELPTPASQNHVLYIADMQNIRDVQATAAEIVRNETSIDALVNNAGAMFGTREVTAEGIERTFAVNHLSYMALTLGLKSVLKPGSRVVNTASFGHARAKYDAADLQLEHKWSSIKAYANSKLYNILFSRQLAKRWRGDHVMVNSFTPPMVATNFGSDIGGLSGPMFKLIARTFGKPASMGAKILTDLAISSIHSGTTGEYFTAKGRSSPSAVACNPANAADLWTQSEQILHRLATARHS